MNALRFLSRSSNRTRKESHSGPNLNSLSGSSINYHFTIMSIPVSAPLMRSRSGSHPPSYVLGSLFLSSVIICHHPIIRLKIIQSVLIFLLQSLLKFNMEITETYVIAADGVFFVLIFINFRPYIARYLGIATFLSYKYFVYP
jgi:hypothetical protein